MSSLLSRHSRGCGRGRARRVPKLQARLEKSNSRASTVHGLVAHFAWPGACFGSTPLMSRCLRHARVASLIALALSVPTAARAQGKPVGPPGPPAAGARRHRTEGASRRERVARALAARDLDVPRRGAEIRAHVEPAHEGRERTRPARRGARSRAWRGMVPALRRDRSGRREQQQQLRDELARVARCGRVPAHRGHGLSAGAPRHQLEAVPEHGRRRHGRATPVRLRTDCRRDRRGRGGDGCPACAARGPAAQHRPRRA